MRARTLRSALFLAGLVVFPGCQPAEECAMTSALDSFEPLCSGEMIRYVGETRVFIYGNGGTLTAYLLEDVGPGTYGGTSGNPLSIILDEVGGTQRLADDRLSTLTFARVDAGEAELRIVADFDGQAIKGPLVVPISDVSGTDTGL